MGDFALCLKITKKVSFKIASEASYVLMILSGQKLVKNAKIEKLNCDISDDFQTLCFLVFKRDEKCSSDNGDLWFCGPLLLLCKLFLLLRIWRFGDLQVR